MRSESADPALDQAAAGRRLRHVVIGVGAGVFNMHRAGLELGTVEVVGVSDLNVAVGRQRASELGCAFFADYRQMLAEARPAVAVVMTPHPFHAEIAIDCLRAGCHVLTEKPMAVQVAEADRMIDAAADAGRVLAVNFQYRHRPEVRAARELVRSGALGQLQRVELVATWTRTGAYYEAAPWRGTWAGEGGGVLMNQGIHHLDLLCYVVGAPSRVVGWTRTLLQRIETEDTAQAMLEWPDGALGTLHLTTAEAGEPERLELVGTRGVARMEYRSGSPPAADLTFETFETDLRDHVAHDPRPYTAPGSHPAPVAIEAGTGDHAAVYRDFHTAILGGTAPAASGVDGRMSLELANAVIYSSHTGAAVTLPLDRGAYAALLAELRADAR